ncbi:alpha/beta hydrolase [Algoriphagus sediminis]|uniref:Alpha/beta hydrolase n=1 Tax=Algoriphagus sediminis TaxID=3057113 RepID=A0ABT7Y9M3_9BACT|nr:alpha/beta hydrolase [Algoriphagus sediminis]MDN3203217.1 alpha/beta hydrolase [Algoriphagus sediminis]
MKAPSLLLALLIFTGGCAFKAVKQEKDIQYTSKILDLKLPKKELNVFAPKFADNLPVLVFFYGGSWESGKKETYGFLGRRLARRDLVVVIADYPLSPEYQIQEMEKSAVEAILWTKYNIQEYGGDPNRIVASGHSAGAHLASLVTMKNDIWDSLGIENPIAAAILNDPGGVDMPWFFEVTKGTGEGDKYYKTFTEDPEVWEEYSSIYALDGDEPPILVLKGENTYPGIDYTVDRFMEKADSLNADVEVSLYKKKKHIPMITQFFWTWSQGYDDVIDFMENLD